jgi:hypothetical protein
MYESYESAVSPESAEIASCVMGAQRFRNQVLEFCQVL